MTIASLNPLKRLDPRITRELVLQRRLIGMGMLCVVIAALFDVGLLFCVNSSVSAIQRAAPRSLAVSAQLKPELDSQADRVAEKLGLPKKETENRFESQAQAILNARADGAAAILARSIGQSPQTIRPYLEDVQNKPQGDKEVLTRLGFICLGVVVLVGCKYWFSRGQIYFLTAAASRLTTEFRRRLYSKLLDLPVSYFGNTRIGSIQSILTNDVNVYQSAVTAIRDSIQGPISIVFSFAYVVYLAPKLAGAVIVFVPPMVYIINRNGRKIKTSAAKVQDDLAELSANTIESLQGMRVIKAFAAETESRERYGTLVNTSYQSQLANARRVAALRRERRPFVAYRASLVKFVLVSLMACMTLCTEVP